MDYKNFQESLAKTAWQEPFTILYDDNEDATHLPMYSSMGNRKVYIINTKRFKPEVQDLAGIHWFAPIRSISTPLEWYFSELVKGKNSSCKAIISFGIRECHMLNHLGVKNITFIKRPLLESAVDLDEVLREAMERAKVKDKDVVNISLGDYTTAAIIRLSHLFPNNSFVDYFHTYERSGLSLWKPDAPRVYFDTTENVNRYSLMQTNTFREELRKFFTENISRSVTVNDISDLSLYQILKGNGYHLPKSDNPLVINLGFLDYDNLEELKSKAIKDKNYHYAFICLDTVLEKKWYEDVPRTYVNRMKEFTIISDFQALPRVTFILPTTGRRTINKAIDSISNQNPYRYYPIMILSDLEPANGAELGRTSGITRNKALELIKSGWVGFLDDDDELSPGAIEKIYPYMRDYDIIIPRALYNDGQLAWTEPKMIGGNVGIWFFYNKSRFPDHRFPLGFYEDFRFIQSMEFDKARIKFIDEVTYVIRPSAN